MTTGSKLYNYQLIDNSILHLKLMVKDLNKSNADALYDAYSGESDLPAFNDFILDALDAEDIEDAALAILMKSLEIMKQANGYLVIVVTEDFLQKVMMDHPEMFDYLAVFHSVDDAVAYIVNSRG